MCLRQPHLYYLPTLWTSQRYVYGSGFVVITIQFFSSFMTYRRVCKQSNTTGITCKTGPVYPSGAPEFTPRSEVCIVGDLVFSVVFSRWLFVLLSFFFAIALSLLLVFWPLWYL
jgi:hypothetical protein